MSFQASDGKGQHILDFFDENLKLIKPLYSKRGLWLRYFSHSNSLCVQALRAIVNYTSISKYRLRFFPYEKFKCPCDLYPIEIRRHILYEYRRYNNYWNPRRDTISHFTLFLEFNNSAFSFRESII